MGYVVNVAIDNRHYFATDERSISDEKKAKQIANELESFYVSKNIGNVQVTITMWVKTGQSIERPQEQFALIDDEPFLNLG
jgi:hypothetical protein